MKGLPPQAVYGKLTAEEKSPLPSTTNLMSLGGLGLHEPQPGGTIIHGCSLGKSDVDNNHSCYDFKMAMVMLYLEDYGH